MTLPWLKPSSDSGGLSRERPSAAICSAGRCAGFGSAEICRHPHAPLARGVSASSKAVAMKIGMISNRRSHRNRHSLAAIEQNGAFEQAILHRPLDGISGIDQTLEFFARSGVEVLAINGGDGTVQAVLTSLLNTRPFRDLPYVAILPGGMTNMSAAGLGLGGSLRKAVERLIRQAADGQTEPRVVLRPLLRLRAACDQPPRYGFFFGAAAIVTAIKLCHRSVYALGLEAGLANAMTLAGALAHWLFARPSDSLFRPEDMLIALDDGINERKSLMLVLATTLDRLVLGSRPFWNVGNAPIRFTAITYPPNGLVRYAARVLFGGDQRRLPEEVYRSRGVHSIALRMACDFTVDGELYAPPAGRPLLISVSEKLRFIQL